MYRYTDEDRRIITAARKANKDKRAEKRLYALELRASGKSLAETNPIEQIWKELRKMGFRNEVFDTLKKVVERLCDTICALSMETIRSITGRQWILNCFIEG